MKEYQGEKAIISLTSWKARINTVGKTIFNLYKMCPGFHIVLCLSEEEFPKKEKELPVDLMLMANANIFEILWVYKNYKAFKKILFTMDKYRDVPVISADDDCIYKCNYAQILYDKWVKNKNSFISFWGRRHKKVFHLAGYATLNPPYAYKDSIKYLNDDIIKLSQDDNFYTCLRQKLNLTKAIILNKDMDVIVDVHDEKRPLHNTYRNINQQLIFLKMERIINLYKNKNYKDNNSPKNKSDS